MSKPEKFVSAVAAAIASHLAATTLFLMFAHWARTQTLEWNPADPLLIATSPGLF